MLKVNQIKLPLNHSKKQLKEAIVHKLRIRPEEMIDYQIIKQSIDARKSGKGGHAGEVLYQYSVAVTLANEKHYLKKHHDFSVNNTNYPLFDKKTIFSCISYANYMAICLLLLVLF